LIPKFDCDLIILLNKRIIYGQNSLEITFLYCHIYY